MHSISQCKAFLFSLQKYRSIMAQVCPAKRTCLDLKNCIVFLLLFPEGGRVGHLGAFCIQSLNIRWTWQSHMGEATQDFGTRTNAHKKHQDSRLTIISINSSSGLSRDLWRLKQEMPKKWLRFYKGTSDQDDDMTILRDHLPKPPKICPEREKVSRRQRSQ